MILRSLNILKKMASFKKTNPNPNNKTKKSNEPDEFEAFTQKMNDDVFQQYKKKIQKDTILRNFRKQIFKKQQICQEFVQMQKNLAMQQKELDKMINSGTKQDVIKYSKKIMQKLLNKKKIFRQNSTTPVFSDYGDYSSYKQNYAKLQDRNLVDGQKLDVDKSTQKWYDFIQSLPDDYEQKQNVKDHIRNQFDFSYDKISISDYGKMKQAKAEQADFMSKAQLDAYDTYVYGKQRFITTDTQEEQFDKALQPVDPETLTLSKSARLSPQAVNTIYQLYIQGWSVRQISKRFGIIPQRTKFCIWSRATFYDQYLPKYGVQYMMECMQEQAQLGNQFGYMDYGLDLDKIQNSRMPQEIIQWNQKRVDSQRKPEQYINALRILDEKKKFTKYQMVEVGTHGKQNAMYSLKEWKIFRGRGSDDVHLRDKTFRTLSKSKRKMVKSYY